jgi:hypothetical protein
MRPFSVWIAAIALPVAACNPATSHLIGTTPAMVSVCSAEHRPWQETLDVAEKSCSEKGRHAGMASGTGQKCPGYTSGLIYNFECVAD